ncbi:MAG: hypothetical protein EAZ87_05625 [Nostocales cyanobacterium]|nr:MAG: hypothetical protein EAZ87_05625 [Nostocales cyanobacterium]
MSNHELSLTIYNSALLSKIATQICKAIVTIYNQQPEFLREKYRKVKWENSSNQLALINKFIELLSTSKNWEEVIKKVEVSLAAILENDIINSPTIRELIITISRENLKNNNGYHHSLTASDLTLTLQPLGIAVLLLDAENLQINLSTEKFLATVCHFPIHVKIAFANWSNRGKLDIELHERGYDLIHVPAGRDNADGKMIAYGASIHELYPHTKEVFVCSSDKVMTNLCNNLQQHGLIVYQVSQHGDNINIFNNSTGRTTVHNINPPPELPSLEKFIFQLKTIIKEEQKLTGVYWIKLSQIYQIYKNQYQLNISDIICRYFPGKLLRDILINNPTDFVIHQIDDQGEIYVNLFTDYRLKDTHQESLLLHESPSSLSSDLLTIDSVLDLENAIKTILTELSTKFPNQSFDISLLAGKFKQKYSKPITEQMKELRLGGNFVKFLQSRNSFNMQLKDNKWEVSGFASVKKFVEISSEIHSALDLEQALINIVLELISQTHNSCVDASVLGVKFHHKYGKPITKQMKDIKINGSFIKFLKSCHSFQIQQNGNKYQVSIQVSISQIHNSNSSPSIS